MIGFTDCIWKLLPLGNRRGNEQQLNRLKLTIEQHHHHHISKMETTVLLHLMWHCKESLRCCENSDGNHYKHHKEIRHCYKRQS